MATALCAVQKVCEHAQSEARPRGECLFCGMAAPDEEPVIKRGAIVVAFDPVAVWWRGIPVPFSRIEANVFAVIARRGRLLLADVDAALEEIGASVATRSLVLGHIRRKLQSLGACNPIEKVGLDCIRLRVDPDHHGSTSVVIGQTQPRYGKIGEGWK